MIALFVWRGPDWGLVVDAFRLVAWEWVVAAIALNLLSVIARAAAWDQVIEQAMPPPHAAVPRRLLRIRRRALRERRPARPDRRARAGRGSHAAIAEQRRGDAWATLVGTVFAHRVFDLFPTLLLIVYVAVDGEDPALGVDEPDDRSSIVALRRSSRSRSRARGATSAPCSRRPGACAGS